MAYGYNTNSQQNSYPQGNTQNPMQVMNQNQMPMPNQNIQPLFPQPQGNVYNINSTLEVANVPVGAGVSVALCMPENVMFIKTMQNGNPLFYPYRILPFTNEMENNSTPAAQAQDTSNSTTNVDLAAQIKMCLEKIGELENIIKDKKKGVDFNV